ncbi:MAG: hypothetical protein FJ039_00430 [Chloroflexi bacterium]|nr:hypothetical protein [Chloroflexota bacterium]
MNRSRFFSRLLIPLSLFTALAMVITACGGDEDEPTATPTRPPAPTATSAPAAPTATRPPTAVPTVTPVPPTPTPSVKRGGILRLRLNNDPSALTQDSWNSAGGSSISWMMPLMSNFVMENPYKAGEIIGDIATSWTTSADGTTWTFKMRTAYDLANNPNREDEILYLHALCDRTEAEMFIWDFLNPHFMEAGAILAAGSVDRIDKGYDSIRLLYRKIREEYLKRCDRIGFNRRSRCMVPEEPPF